MKKLHLIALAASVFVFGCQYKNGEKKQQESVKKIPKQDRINLAIEQEFYMTVDPALGRVPRERLVAAKEYMLQLQANPAFRTNALAWQERGPNNVAGRTRAVFIDRRDASGNTVFAGGVGGGVWRATNFKTNPEWMQVGTNMQNIAVCALAQDPSNPNVMYAGTGEGWFNADAIRGDGIYKSTDGGNTWVRLASTTPSASNNTFDFVQDIIVTSSGIVYAAVRSIYCNAGGSVYRSANGGANWTRVLGTPSSNCSNSIDTWGADLEIAANGDLYATTGIVGTGSTEPGVNTKGKIFKSPASLGGNQGTLNNWNEITPPVTSPAGVHRRIEIACAPSDANVVYALIQGKKSATNTNDDGSGVSAIKRSNDGGLNWTDATVPVGCGTSPDFTNGQAWYNLIIQVDPNNANAVWIGGIDLLRSNDGGLTWSQRSSWNGACPQPIVHADQHNILFFPGSSNEWIATNDGGVYYTSNTGNTWIAKNTGYNVTQYYACDVHPANTNYYLAGAQDNGTQKFQSPGINNTVTVSGGDGAYCHIDQTDGQIQVTSYVYNNYYYSRNGGVSFTPVAGGGNTGRFINPSDYDDVNDVVYTAHNNNTMGVITGLAGTGTPAFTSVTVSALNGKQISAVKVDPIATNATVWIAGSGGVPNLIKLANANTTNPTVQVNTNLNILSSGAYVSSIDVDANNVNHLLITVSNYGMMSVLESVDGGVSFTNVEGNLPDMPVRWGMFLPANAYINSSSAPGGILLGTEMGVWATTQTSGAATTWAPQNNGLPNVRVDMLKLRAADNTVAAATHGRGLWTSSLPSIATAVNPVANTKGFIQNISNNSSHLFVRIGNLTTKNMELRLFDMNGRQVLAKRSAYANQTVEIGLLSRGGYIIKIFGNNKEQFTQQFVK